MNGILFTGGRVITGNNCGEGAVAVRGRRIESVLLESAFPDRTAFVQALSAFVQKYKEFERFDLGDRILMAGGIDAHVHFREPGLSHKADISSESLAALLGGVTSVIDMPNTKPAVTTAELLTQKYALAADHCHCNYAFNIGAAADNIGQLASCKDSPAVKVFMGSSTGNMLVDDADALERIFALDRPVLIHSEDEATIRAGLEDAKKKYGDDIPFSAHPEIRSRRACIISTIKALELAGRLGTRLHILHVSTAEEVNMIRAAKLHFPHITAETSGNYLTFCDEDYEALTWKIKCNPAIKSSKDRQALIEGFRDGTIDTLGSDHAPHLVTEKDKPYLQAPSGIPSIQHQLPAVLEIAQANGISLSRVAEAFSEKIADILGIRDRGRIAEGYHADLVIVRDSEGETVESAYKCGWSPYDGRKFRNLVDDVFLGGVQAVRGGRLVSTDIKGEKLEF